MRKCYISLGGYLGAGKSTFARILADSLEVDYYETDQYMFNDAGEYEWSFRRLTYAIQKCREDVKFLMEGGADNVVVCGVFRPEKDIKPYLDLAEEFGYRIVSLVVENRHGNKSTHDVPDATLEKMRRGFSVKL